MTSIEDIPIKKKLTFVIMLTCTVVLVLTCATFIIYEFVAYRQSITRNLETIAKVIAANSTASLAFQNENDARDILSALKAERHIEAAALYDNHGKLFAKYPASAPDAVFPLSIGWTGHRFENGYLIHNEPVVADKRLGTLHLRSDLRGLYQRTRLYITITLIVLAGSSLIAFALSRALQKRISKPILELADTAREVSENQDYTLRANKFGKDELGQLTDAFNDMLKQIHERDLTLSEKEERLRLALEGSRTGVWDWNLVTGKVELDQFLHPLFGVPKEAFSDGINSFSDLAHPDDRLFLGESIRQAIDQKADFFSEFRVILPDGSVRSLVARGKAFYDPQGKPVRMIGVAADISERIRTERALRESEEKYRRLSRELEQRVEARTTELASLNHELEAFTYSVSHDLRAPLRHINAFAQLLREELGTSTAPEVQKYVMRIIDGAKNMGRLVDDLLNLARVGKQELTRQLAPLKPMVEEIVSSLKPELAKRQIEWRIGDLPPAECDPGLMKQVFFNLISNAVKYSGPREKAVIEIDKIMRDGKSVIFVRDNGVGFNMKYAQKLFGVFQRLHQTEEFEGTGVGLATVARIIQKHHGKIWAEAEENKGATFYFTFSGIK